MEVKSNNNEMKKKKDSLSEDVKKEFFEFAKKHFVYLFFYVLGYFEFSIAWWILFCLINRQLLKSDNGPEDDGISFIKETVKNGEKKTIESKIRVEDLPPWFMFPDKERAEWINTLIKQLWLSCDGFFKEKLTKACQSLGTKNIRFDILDLGSIPPRVTGIKIYETNVERNVAKEEAIVDLDLDVNLVDCDIKINWQSVPVKLKNFRLKGLLRLTMTPILNYSPVIGGLKIYFAEKPDITINAEAIGVDFNLNKIQEMLEKIIAKKMVYPQKITKSFTKEISSKQMKCPESSGVLGVKLFKAEGLKNTGTGIAGDISDPYAVISVGGKTVTTKVVQNSLNPEWNFCTYFPIDEVLDDLSLIMEVKDCNPIRKHYSLGKATIAISDVAEKGEIIQEWKKLDVKSGKIQFSLSWWVTTKNKEDLQAKPVNCGLLHIFIDSCHNLESPNLSNPTSFVKLFVENPKESQVTRTKKNKTDPTFAEVFIFTIFDTNDELHIRVMDKSSNAPETEIGFLDIPLAEIINAPNMELYQKKRSLRGSGHRAKGEILFSANMRALKEIKNHNHQERELTPPSTPKHLPRSIKKLSDTLSSPLTTPNNASTTSSDKYSLSYSRSQSMGFNSPENKERKLTHAHSPPKSLSEAIKKISETFSSPAMLNMSKTSIQEVDEDITERAVSDDTKIDASDAGAILGDSSSENLPLKKSKSCHEYPSGNWGDGNRKANLSLSEISEFQDEFYNEMDEEDSG